MVSESIVSTLLNLISKVLVPSILDLTEPLLLIDKKIIIIALSIFKYKSNLREDLTLATHHSKDKPKHDYISFFFISSHAIALTCGLHMNS